MSSIGPYFGSGSRDHKGNPSMYGSSSGLPSGGLVYRNNSLPERTTPLTPREERLKGVPSFMLSAVLRQYETEQQAERVAARELGEVLGTHTTSRETKPDEALARTEPVPLRKHAV